MLHCDARTRLVRIAAALGILLALMARHALARAKTDAEVFQALARQTRLAESLPWQRLLHYHSAFLSDAASEIDGPEFFLAEAGKVDPSAELDATLAAFFAPMESGHADEHALCRFPARFAFLDRALGLSIRLTKPDCPALNRFLSRVDPDRVSLVYAANSLEYPASAFGHTFIYLERRSGARAGRADTSVDFQADTDTNFPPLYAFKGLAGLFDGRFRIEAASRKLREYAVSEDRDLWVFELGLTPSELELLRLHLWELSRTRIDYFYLSENCSYHVLGALEAAAPRLPLTARTKFAVLPMDAIKALYATEGLVRSVRYVPSHSSRELASRRFGTSDTAAKIPWEQSPEHGHGTMRFDFGAGGSTLGASVFATVGYRLALHDLVDPTDGHAQLAQVQFLDTRLRYDVTQHRLLFDHLTFAELIALHPLTNGDARASWRAGAYGERLHDRRCRDRDCFAHGVNASVGATAASEENAFAVFLMADAFVRFSGQLDGISGSWISAGIGPYAGMRLCFSSVTIAWLSASWSYLPAQNLAQTYDLTGKLRSALTRDFAWGIESRLAPAAFQAELVSYVYF